jgi:thiamine pyrophosphokinase
MHRIAILANGDYGDYSWCPDFSCYQQVICADNGIHHARNLGILPAYILGDFDSANEVDLTFFKNQNCILEQVAAEKDETDTELALYKAFELGATHVDILGGLGSRFDHSLCNAHLLYQGLKRGITVRLFNARHTVYLINRQLTLHEKIGQLISLIPFSEKVIGVHTKGLAYEITGGVFKIGDVYGVSNYFLREEVTICLESGLLLVILAKD